MAIDIIGNLLLLLVTSAMVGLMIGGVVICLGIINGIGSLLKKGFKLELSDNITNVIMTVIGVIFGLIVLVNGDLSEPTVTQSKIYISIFDNTEVTDKQVEREKEVNNTFKNDNEVIDAVLYKYGVGSKIKGYTISTSTEYYQVGGSYYDSKRSFIVGFNLTNGRVAYLKGVATKKNGNIKVKVNEVILE
ncbi:MAG: hypothetical protein LBI82_06465 [Dysgonamonadaceae bacterium]|jgi:hypothetical protein|nr:hypothetical protein [Dysgonamonadaceae bacterium]